MAQDQIKQALIIKTLTCKALASVPDLLALHARHPARYPHLLSSNAQRIKPQQSSQTQTPSQSHTPRFDILFACPQQTIHSEQTGFLEQLDVAWQAEAEQFRRAQPLNHADDPVLADLPFTGGWFLYLGYELAQQIEPGLQLPAAEDGLPVAFATRFPAAIIIDAHNEQAYLLCEASFADCLAQIETDLAEAADSSLYRQPFEIGAISEDNEAEYLQQLERLHRYIVDGDVFQVNLSRRWQTRLSSQVNHASLYHQLSRSNPGPFNALMTLGERAVISSSPERLIQLKNGWLETRPIAGTRPRSDDQSADTALSTELMAHPKERAEHIMLIDLERNDLGRVCEPGSIEVNELMVLESYRHVHHIVSNVRGRPRADITPGQLIAAVFPGGTITGCPKVRCMEILAELEQCGRGAYTGSLGYLNHDGSMDLNILIRSISRNGDQLQFRAGGGIVVDSNPHNELNETRAKARGLLHALRAGNKNEL
ncbi:MAG TPA: aminodeoxychorismate synthase component I [Gammaproteobacteria bacterium]